MGRRSARGRGHTPEPAAPQVSWSSYVWPLAFLLVAVGSIYIFANLRKSELVSPLRRTRVFGV